VEVKTSVATEDGLKEHTVVMPEGDGSVELWLQNGMRFFIEEVRGKVLVLSDQTHMFIEPRSRNVFKFWARNHE
jgi:hypothetical protein